jgi:hypothetical protein
MFWGFISARLRVSKNEIPCSAEILLSNIILKTLKDYKNTFTDKFPKDIVLTKFVIHNIV